MRAALDTNILLYAEGLDHDRRRPDRALDVLAGAPKDRLVIPVQVLGEAFNVLLRKSGRSATAVSATVWDWARRGEVVDTSAVVFGAALELAAQHHLSIWDSVVFAAAVEARCDLLLTEDLHPGFRWRGVTVVNPFEEPMSPLLDAFMSQAHG